MPYRAIIFDLDGTLLDTIGDLADSINAVLSENGLPNRPRNEFRYIIGDGMEMALRRLLPESMHNPSMLKSFVDMVRDEYSVRWNSTSMPYPGIPGLLDYLKRKDIRTAVLSNKPHDFTVLMIESILDRWQFDSVLGLSDRFPRKPDPASTLFTARALEVDPPDIIFLGDTSIDMKTARAAGMFAAGALWGYRERDELDAAGAHILVEHPADLMRLFP